ncbi:hypothetical protein MLD38_033436 [Melastoma candidum]|uniref:Uncharacterized protein n=1 Tax=Melastoma candidum TaxID=119954 RepID=A0ACB9M8V8_9MYRT|nr:hypothetical protein MLD38_033436 [Melastoma candidum]
MSKFLTTTLTFAILISTSLSQTCKNYNFPDGVAAYDSCIDLPVHGSFLHWNYTPSTSTADIAYRCPETSPAQWIAWAVNPSGGTMIGSQALVAYLSKSGSVHAYTSSVDTYATELSEGKLSFEVPSVSGSYVNGEMTVFARLQLGSDIMVSNATQVWMVGPMRKDGVPSMHFILPGGVKPVMALDLAYNHTRSDIYENSTRTMSDDELLQMSWNVHGVLNTVSWGTLLPTGVLVARYLKASNPTDKGWFYLHSGCQGAAYAIGTAGWATGRWLGGSDASTVHGTIGLILFILSTLQVLSIFLRPAPDHRLRVYWNVYHHTSGYTAILLSIVNVYKGLNLLDPLMIWKQIYTGILVFLGSVAVLLEIIGWVIIIRRKRKARTPNF